jgi:hypothetical protein
MQNKQAVNISDIKIGTMLEAKKMVMVVTGENAKRFLGYTLYKGKNVGECNIEKDMFKNPHYMYDIKIISK